MNPRVDLELFELAWGCCHHSENAQKLGKTKRLLHLIS
jgi:hypothetical protein